MQHQPKSLTKTKLHSSRNYIKRDTSNPQRLKSQHQDQYPISAILKRPSSANHTTLQPTSDNHIQNIIIQTLTTNPTVKQSLIANQYDQHQIIQQLLSNQLFILSLTTTIANKNQQEVSDIVQQAIIRKIKRIKQYETHNNSNTQNRIANLISQRLKKLSNLTQH